MNPEDVNKLLAERDEVIATQQTEIDSLKTKFDGLVKFVNEFIKASDQKTNAIDSVAFAAFAMHEEKGDTFKLDTTSVTEARARIEKVLEEFNTFREELMAESKRRAEKEAKSLAKKAEVKAKRDAKKGKTLKEVVSEDESTTTDASN